ncbi:MAG TPA: sodium:proton antiporter, partial [Planctomycetota bacterium]|nr:sodium:proton antiporter [Planctomycetota bacterium]
MPPPFPSMLWILPFAATLLAIAALPLAAPHFWERNRNKALVVGGLALPVLFRLLAVNRGALAHVAREYVSFMALVGSLYVISAGILVEGDIEAKPRVNALILLLGAVLANLFGTTGASMLLVRPLLRINRQRRRVAHTVIFFIFLVANVGGCLTPLGDPPLVLGFLGGVPFLWTLRLWAPWAFATAGILAVYLAMELVEHGRESP